jgi:hypothetical protein
VSEQTLFELIDRLLSLPQLTKEAVEAATGIRLEAIDPDDPYFITWGGEAPEGSDRDLALVELRVPTEKARPKDGILVVDLNPELEIEAPAIFARYGGDARPVPASPDGLGDEPDYLCYEHEGGRLSFGLIDAEPRALVNVVIDRTERG